MRLAGTVPFPGGRKKRLCYSQVEMDQKGDARVGCTGLLKLKSKASPSIPSHYCFLAFTGLPKGWLVSEPPRSYRTLVLPALLEKNRARRITSHDPEFCLRFPRKNSIPSMSLLRRQDHGPQFKEGGRAECDEPFREWEKNREEEEEVSVFSRHCDPGLDIPQLINFSPQPRGSPYHLHYFSLRTQS